MRRTFVVGCPRSGTTLVQAMLARHPDVYSLQETYFLESALGGAAARWGDRDARRGQRWYHRAGFAQSWGRRRLRELEKVYWPTKHWWHEPLRWSACMKRYVSLLDHAALAHGKSHWVEKTPNHLLFLDELERYVPDARFVHVLRNGLDVVASVVDADLQHGTSAFRGGLALWAARWNYAMDLHLAKARESNHYLICLEDLVANPAAEWARLRTFLDLSADAPLLARPGSAIADSDHEPWKRAAIAGIVQPPVRKAAGLFGPRALSWLDAHLADYRAIRDAVERSHRPRSPDNAPLAAETPVSRTRNRRAIRH